MFDRLDGDLAWLEALGARPAARETGNPLTTGARFDTRALTAALARAAGGEVRLGEPLRELPGDAAGRAGDAAASRPTATLVREHVTPAGRAT